MEVSKKRRQSTDISSRNQRHSTMTVLSLPKEIWVKIFSGLHIRDITATAKSCRFFRDVTTSATVWKEALFFKAWPNTDSNYKIFCKAAQCDNFEAMIKLAFSKLYNKRLPAIERNQSLDDHAREAAFYFMNAERLAVNTFSWIFLRPPWQAQATCCKSRVFASILDSSNQQDQILDLDPVVNRAPVNGRLAYIVSEILKRRNMHAEAQRYRTRAAELGWHEARMHEWQLTYAEELDIGQFSEPGREMTAMRDLRSIVRHSPQGSLWEVVNLCIYYVSRFLGGVSWRQAQNVIRELFQSSPATNVDPVLARREGLNSSMRYILVDWLAEVSSNIGLETNLLQNAVAIVDRCLVSRNFRRGEIQLLGVAALLITSRAFCEEILTIREAAWYTDHSYSYEQVVEMISDIVSILRGDVRLVTNATFCSVLEPVDGLGDYERFMCDYAVEMCMLHSHMTQYSPAQMAASCVLLVRIWQEFREAWPMALENLTGFSAEDLTPCVLSMNKCLRDDVRHDSHNIPMLAVRKRFQDPLSYDMTKVKCLTEVELRTRLGALVPSEDSKEDQDVKPTEELCSLSRGKQRAAITSHMERPSRDDSATPPVDMDASGYEADNDEDSNESFCSIPVGEKEKEAEPKTSFTATEAGSDSGESAEDAKNDTSTLPELEALLKWSFDEKESTSDSSNAEPSPAGFRGVEGNGTFSFSSNDSHASSFKVVSGVKCIESVQESVVSVGANSVSSFNSVTLADGERVACRSVNQMSIVIGSSQQAGQGIIGQSNVPCSSFSADQGFDHPTDASSSEDSAPSEGDVDSSSSCETVLRRHEMREVREVRRLRTITYVKECVAHCPGVESEEPEEGSPAVEEGTCAVEDKGLHENCGEMPPPYPNMLSSALVERHYYEFEDQSFSDEENSENYREMNEASEQPAHLTPLSSLVKKHEIQPPYSTMASFGSVEKDFRDQDFTDQSSDEENSENYRDMNEASEQHAHLTPLSSLDKRRREMQPPYPTMASSASVEGYFEDQDFTDQSSDEENSEIFRVVNEVIEKHAQLSREMQPPYSTMASSASVERYFKDQDSTDQSSDEENRENYREMNEAIEQHAHLTSLSSLDKRRREMQPPYPTTASSASVERDFNDQNFTDQSSDENSENYREMNEVKERSRKVNHFVDHEYVSQHEVKERSSRGNHLLDHGYVSQHDSSISTMAVAGSSAGSPTHQGMSWNNPFQVSNLSSDHDISASEAENERVNLIYSEFSKEMKELEQLVTQATAEIKINDLSQPGTELNFDAWGSLSEAAKAEVMGRQSPATKRKCNPNHEEGVLDLYEQPKRPKHSSASDQDNYDQPKQPKYSSASGQDH